MVKTMPSKWRSVASVVAALAMLLTSSTGPVQSAPAANDPIKIGVEFPLTGSSQGAGTCLLNGFKLYLDQVHNTMGGRKVKLIAENDETNPATAKAKVRKLGLEDKCPILGGVFMSNALYAIQPVIENELKQPFVVVSAGADDISQRKRGKWIVRTCYTSSQPSHPMGDYAYNKLKMRKVVVICSDYAYGYEVAGGFQQVFEDAGGKVIQKLWAPLGFKDFSPILKDLRTDADGIFLCLVGQSATIVPKEIRAMGIKTPFIGVTASFDESFYPQMGDELVGAVSASLYSTALETAANKKFVSEYKAKYGEEPSYFSEHGYTAAMWIDKAVNALKGNVSNKEALLAALKNVELTDAPRGPVKLDKYGTSVDNIYIRRVERKNGKLQNTVIYTYPLVSQFWKWSPEVYLKQPCYSKEWPK